ncbi:uncharacterized protein CDAR_405231 [Caerostris darwini]|uniref:C2H2-type domain-containing protein n=1 Tax=Caerostris darwini TaxID=1538125 RepID=A0AAV4QGV8_9ARAC|nr:uncharacterized protein CDAR_405231 [Caerostris darwini]
MERLEITPSNSDAPISLVVNSPKNGNKKECGELNEVRKLSCDKIGNGVITSHPRSSAPSILAPLRLSSTEERPIGLGVKKTAPSIFSEKKNSSSSAPLNFQTRIPSEEEIVQVNATTFQVRAQVHANEVGTRPNRPKPRNKRPTNAGPGRPPARESKRELMQTSAANIPETVQLHRTGAESKVQPNSQAQKCFYKFPTNNYNKLSLPGKKHPFYLCHVCKGTYKQKYSLKRHFIRNHVNPMYLHKSDLSNCKINSPYQESLEDLDKEKMSSGRRRFDIDGVKWLSKNEKEGEEYPMPNLFKCHECPKVKFNLEIDLIKHYKIHLKLNDGEEYSCKRCQIAFKEKLSFCKHLLTCQKQQTFSCKKCKLKFHEVTEFTKHLHSEESTECSYCCEEFETVEDREVHEEIHWEETYKKKRDPIKFNLPVLCQRVDHSGI